MKEVILPQEMYVKKTLPDGRTISYCTMRQRILHCIGMVDGCAHKPYTRHGKKFYRPWRNYFATNYPDLGWDELCEAGYAAHGTIKNWEHGKGTTYWMTRAGLDWLGELLGIHIYDEED